MNEDMTVQTPQAERSFSQGRLLGRIFAYDFGDIAKRILPFAVLYFGLALISALLSRVPEIPNEYVAEFFTIVSMLINLLFSVAEVAFPIVCIVYLVLQFNRTMYSAEGYMTFTLPAKADAVLLSKVLQAIAWLAIMTVIIGGADCIFYSIVLDDITLVPEYVFPLLSQFAYTDAASVITEIVMVTSLVLYYVIALYWGRTMIRLSRNKGIFLLAFAAAAAARVTAMFTMLVNFELIFMFDQLEDETAFLADTVVFGAVAAINLISIVVVYFLMRHKIRKHLNL